MNPIFLDNNLEIKPRTKASVLFPDMNQRASCSSNKSFSPFTRIVADKKSLFAPWRKERHSLTLGFVSEMWRWLRQKNNPLNRWFVWACSLVKVQLCGCCSCYWNRFLLRRSTVMSCDMQSWRFTIQILTTHRPGCSDMTQRTWTWEDAGNFSVLKFRIWTWTCSERGEKSSVGHLERYSPRGRWTSSEC